MLVRGDLGDSRHDCWLMSALSAFVLFASDFIFAKMSSKDGVLSSSIDANVGTLIACFLGVVQVG